MNKEEQFKYQTGFGNEFATEVVEGALPIGQNSPQKVPLGLYAEQFSGTSFTAPRVFNKRTWTYRIRPSVLHKPFVRIENSRLVSQFDELETTPNQLRWNPLADARSETDFVDGITTIAGNGDSFSQHGMAVHIFACNKNMTERFFYNADGEMLVVAEKNRVRFLTELGIIEIKFGRNCRSSARFEISRRTARRRRSRLHLRKLRAAFSSARFGSDRREWSGESARF